MEPDVHGGTQTGVILWRITDCVFKFGLRAIPPRKGSHDKLRGVKLMCRWLCSWWLWLLCVSVLNVGNGGWEVFPSALVEALRYCREVGICCHPFCWIAWLFLVVSFSLILVLLSSLFSEFLAFGNLPQGYGVGKPSWVWKSCWGFILSTTRT